MSYNISRSVPKAPNPFALHATSQAQAFRLVERQIRSEIRPENGYGQGECVQSVSLVSETDAQYNFTVRIFGD